MKYFNNYPYTAETLKSEYRELCKKLHPDTGGSEEAFEEMVNEYEQTARNLDGTRQNQKAAEEVAEALRRAAERMRQHEEERREAERRAEENRRRREREKEEERKRREAARPAYDARCKKWAHLMEDLKPYREAVTAASQKESEAGRVHGWRSPEYKAAEKATRAARTAENAARRRNLLKMAQTAFKGVKFSLKYDNGWGGGYTVSWQDGPSVQEMEAATDYYLFVSMWDTFDGMTDCADVESAMFTDFAQKYNGHSGKVEFSRTISEANRKKLEDVLIKFAPDLGKNDDPETRKRYGLASDWDDIKVSLDADKLREILRIFGADFDELNEKREFRYMYDYSRYTLAGWVKNLAEYLTFKTDAEKKAEKQAQPAQFAPRYGEALRTLHKLMGITLGEPEEGKSRVTFWQRVKTGETVHGAARREYVRYTIAEAVEKLQKGETLYFGTFRDKSEKYAASGSGTYNGGYKVQKARAEKFAAAGYEIKGAGYSGTNDYVSVSGIKAETAAAIREELADIERQRQEWEKEQAQPKSNKGAKKATKGAESADVQTTPGPSYSGGETNADGLTMEQYSEKATVIRGYNAQQAAELEEMGGKEWRNLRGGKGFVFSTRRHGDKLREWFEAQQAGETAQAAAEPEPEPQTADTLEQAPEITDTAESDTAAASEDTQTAEEPKQEEKCDELKQWHVEELIKGELRKHHLFTDDRNEAAEYMAAKLEELQQADGVEILSTKKGRVIWYEGGKYHLLYIWNLDESRSMYWMARDSERRRVLNNLAERHAAAMKRKAEAEKAAESADDQTAPGPSYSGEEIAAESTPLEERPEISALFVAVSNFFGTVARIAQEAAKYDGVTIPAATLARWKAETEQGTKRTAETFAEVCACLASLTPDSREKFDALGVIFWTLSEQLRNGTSADTLAPAVEFARAQLFGLIDATQSPNQAARVREAFESFRVAA